VAVTRARRRLYVIGNRAAWAGEPHFDELARNLSE
jgi:superfamily I DNA and/or RNA helicase